MSIVFIKQGKCKGCYNCVRNCPVKAIRVKNGQAEIIDERCVACGFCVPLCAQKAVEIRDDTGLVERMLREGKTLVAAVSSTFPAAFSHVRPLQFPSALRRLGFKYVTEISFAVQMVARAYSLYIKSNPELMPTIASTCPVITTMVEKYFPSLSKSLMPIVSSTVAMGRIIKQKYGNDATVVFIGPCVAKKMEILAADCKDVDICLTYSEIRGMFEKKAVSLSDLPDTEFDGPFASLGRSYPIIGGYWKKAAIAAGLPETETIATGGRNNSQGLLRSLDRGELSAPFVDLLFCEECVNGPIMPTEISTFERVRLIREFASFVSNPEYAQRDMLLYRNVDLSRHFEAKPIHLEVPSEERIKQILSELDMPSPEAERNCGACGYNTCREKAIAVLQGLAEKEMCLPYLMEQLHDSYRTLIQLEKMASLGQMAASIVHQINNPIHGILTYVRLLLKNLGEGRFESSLFEQRLITIEDELNKCCNITRSLLETSRRSEPSLRDVDVNRLVGHVLEFLAHEAKLGNVRFDKRLDPSLEPTQADPDLLHQVFNNLALNAVQAMPNGGCLTVSSFMDLKGQRIGIAFEDTGCGIALENMKKLFTPFFTTKEKGKGVGLGLAVCQQIIKDLGGQIEVESELGTGSRFTVWLNCQRTE
jgi:signal transduction histidine kinase/iron only hydrogenase large subunit-like protein